MAQTFQEFISNSTSYKVYLVKIKAYIKLSSWSLHSGSIYKVGFVKDNLNQSDPLSVRHGLVNLNESDSLGDMVENSWFYDSSNKNIYVWLTAGADPNNESLYSTFWLHFCTSSPKNYFDGLNDWKDIVLKIPTSNRGRTSLISNTTVTYGNLEISNVTGYFNDIWSKYFISASEIEISLTGFKNKPFSSFEDWLPFSESQTILKGLVTKQKYTAQKVTFKVTDFISLFSLNFPLVSYETTSFPNLDANEGGNPIHRGYGVLKGIKAVQVDTTSFKYKVDDQAITSFDSIFDEDGTVLPTSSTDISKAEFVLNAQTSKRVYCNYTKNIGSNYAGSLKKEILENVLNIDSDNIDTTSFSTLDTNRPYPLGVSIPSRKKIGEIFQEINISVLAEDNTSRNGQITTSVLAKPSSADPNQQIYSSYSSLTSEPEFEELDELLASVIFLGHSRDFSKDPEYKYVEGVGAGVDYLIIKPITFNTLLTSKADAESMLLEWKVFIEKPIIKTSFKTQLKPLSQYVSQTINFGDVPTGYGSYWKILRISGDRVEAIQ